MHYIYFWVDDIYSPVRQDDRLSACHIDITEHGRKEVVVLKMIIESQKKT
ncbi:MAG: hypothetical protein ACTS73_05885 [Arsenophonus sp. NEOnobi-MAG3]